MDSILPVIGSSADLVSPTSSDVHLFADVETRNKDRPLFYADSEGLNGGNSLPIAAKRLLSKVKEYNEAPPRSMHKEITYAKDDQKSRQWAVEKLYPRILFPFSDIVCYVTKNPRYVCCYSLLRVCTNLWKELLRMQSKNWFAGLKRLSKSL